MYTGEIHEEDIGDNREFCNCGNLMQFQQEFNFKNCDPPHIGNPYYNDEIYKLFTCSACNSVTIVLYTKIFNEEEEYTQDNWVPFYNRQVLYAPKKQLHPAIPRAIKEVLNQAESVVSNSPRASFILCRAVLEEICNDFKIPNENSKGKFIILYNRLSKLFVQEELSEELQVIIENIKDFGNEGAHSAHLKLSGKIETEDAQNLIILVEYVLERLYVDKYRQQKAEDILKTLKKKVLPDSKFVLGRLS